MTKLVGFYPGCSLNGTAKEYKESVLALAKAFEIELKEVPGWTCCGASAAHSVNKKLSVSLPAFNLLQAAKAGMKELVVPCAACYNRLAVAQHQLETQETLRKEVEEVLGEPVRTDIRILNVIQFIQENISEKLQDRLVRKLGNVACYYGCLLVRPAEVLGFDRVEDPQSMDEIVRNLGGVSIDFPFKTECCGAGLSVSRTDSVARLSGKIVKEACDRGADAIVVACPMCHSNLDMRRSAINTYYQANFKIPVLYLPQAIGLAIGLSEGELGLPRHMVKVDLSRVVSSLLQTQNEQEKCQE